MKILVVGLGSMGKRRIRLLLQFIQNTKKDDWLVSGVDNNRDRCSEAEDTFGIKTFQSIEDAVKTDKYDSVVISTSPISHSAIIEDCLNKDLNVFTEINLIADGYQRNIELSKEKNKVLFLSSTPMYRKEMEYIKQRTEDCSRLQYHYHIGQYLPEWHPWEDYRNFFVANKKTNGCREILAIELPWLIDTFGDVVECRSLHSKNSDLDLDYDDSYAVLIRHDSGVFGVLNVDVVIPKAGREFEVWGENVYLEWKGTPDSLKEFDREEKRLLDVKLYENYDHVDGYNQFVVENAYYDEVVDYIRTIENESVPRYSFEKDLEILKLIDCIEE